MNVSGEIRYFVGDGDYAKLTYSESRTSFSIDVVFVPVAHRRRGIGKTLIQNIIVLADHLEKGIYVSARPLGNVSDENIARLVAYYRGMGFDVYDRGQTVVHMFRAARGGGNQVRG